MFVKPDWHQLRLLGKPTSAATAIKDQTREANSEQDERDGFWYTSPHAARPRGRVAALRNPGWITERR